MFWCKYQTPPSPQIVHFPPKGILIPHYCSRGVSPEAPADMPRAASVRRTSGSLSGASCLRMSGRAASAIARAALTHRLAPTRTCLARSPAFKA